MSNNYCKIEGGISAPKGFIATGIKAGIKYSNKYDVALIKSEKTAKAAGVFTKNLVKAHPLLLSAQHLKDGKAQAVIVNSGNANACMGAKGDQIALEMAQKTADSLAITLEDIVVSSTGVIGEELSMTKMLPGIESAVKELQQITGKQGQEVKTEHAHRAAQAIMTTDTIIKESAYELKCSQGSIKLGVMAKGSGMIHPNMGTMLCFITTDAEIESVQLQKLLRETVDETFNMITVDGDTSTNDMAVIMANGFSGIKPEGREWDLFSAILKKACEEMAKAIARDGEGASKFIETQVNGAASLEDARKIVRTILSSNLVKSAIYGEDANWGRILCAAGYSGACFDPGKIGVYLNGLQVAAGGQGLKFSEEEALQRLKKDDIIIKIELEDGAYSATGWGCDLTHKYVDINACYRT